jgi:eukaryotic-like serine/threonine-protein kinase
VSQTPTWSGGPGSSTSGSSSATTSAPAASGLPVGGRAAPGSLIGGRYSLRAAVGHGGMGTVWRAADTLLRRDVAVKEVVLPPGLAPSDRDAMYERTLREARAAAALQHPAVVQVYDVVTEGGRPWIVMELLDARSLADIVIDDGPMAPRPVAKIGIALLGALEVAHAIGVLHRDVKPANVLICSDGRCVLTDFGVARMPTDVQLTTPGMVLGSPHFISPERAMGSEFGPPSDLFSLGVTLYTAVEGRPPFDKGDPIETMHAVVEDPPAPTSRAGVLTPVLFGLLEKDPADRYDVAAARGMLRELLAGPLASKAPAHLSTDPYAVVPAQRRAAPPPPPPADRPTGQIGGRAMIGPGESLTDRLAALRRDGGTVGDTVARPVSPAYLGSAAAGLAPTGAHQPTSGPGVTAPTSGGGAGGRGQGPGAHGPGPGAHGQGPHGPGPGPGLYGPPPGGYGRSGATGEMPAAPWAAPPASKRSLPDLKAALGRVRTWPRALQLGAAGGLVVLLVLAAIALTRGGDDPSGTPPPAAGPSAAPSAGPPAFETQTEAARGLSVAVPKTWTRNTSGGVWVDFVDPADPNRKVRINVEPSRADAVRFLEAASGRLRDDAAGNCARPYTQVNLQSVELSGQPAGELEYTCGSGDAMRHGIWRAVVSGGKAYSFFLTTREATFAESKPIFDEMVRTFQVTAAG